MLNTPLFLLIVAVHPMHSGAIRVPILHQGTVSQGDSARIATFLRLLASAWTLASAQGAYDPRRAGRWNAQKFDSLLARGGVTFYNVNGDSTWHLAADALRGELGRRRGAGFDMLLHLGYIYTQPYPQYSRLSFTQDSSGVLVRIGGWFQLTFVREGGLLELAKVEYLEREGE